MATAAATTFAYQVRDKSGKLISGTLEADSQGAVAQKLRSMGYAPVKIDPVKESALQKELTIPGFGGRKVKLAELAVFSRQFATMISSGLSLIRALTILAAQTESKALAEVIGEVQADVESGRSLSQALAEHEAFPKLYVAMVRAGETAGMLDHVLLNVANMLEKDVALRRTIKSAMTYPVLVFVMAIGLTAAMLIFIVPTFAGLFDSLGGELPLPTQMLMMASSFITSIPGLLFLVVLPVGLWQAFKYVRKTEQGRYRIDAIKLKAPVFGPLFHKIALSRFSRNLGTLLKAGVPILQALEITGETVNNGPVSAAVQDVQDGVREGEAIATPLREHEVFPPMVVQMIAVGEETGAVDEMLEKIAEFYDQEVEATTEALTSIMEPIMIAVLGGIVGSMVIALYMPIFKIMELVR